MGHLFTPPQSKAYLTALLQSKIFYFLAALTLIAIPYEQSERCVAPHALATIGFNLT